MRVDETRFREIAETTLEWTKRARGPEAIERTVDAYAQSTTEVNMAQARYEIAGEYEHKSYQESGYCDVSAEYSREKSTSIRPISILMALNKSREFTTIKPSHQSHHGQ